jgi:HPt (histidine-containing phosphotransfer) domain-containing protein
MTDVHALIEGLRAEASAAPLGLHRLEVTCRKVEKANNAGKGFPGWLRPLFRNQHRINRLLIWGLRELLNSHVAETKRQQRQFERLEKEVAELKARLQSR